MSGSGTIEFYKKTDPYYEFSNFYMHKKLNLLIDEQQWLNIEQYFQSQKFYNTDYYNIIKSTDSPMKATILGRQKIRGGYAGNWVVNKLSDTRTLNEVIALYQHIKIRDDWEIVKDDIMFNALKVKFSDSNPLLKKLLLDTEHKKIIEASPRDSYWGWGADHKGQNKLGLFLEKTRDNIL